jgi:CPA2 family monovalent cation:H+ antiporter-2
MKALQHILAASDSTDGSRFAVDRGFQLASANNAPYTIAHGIGIDDLTLLQGLLADTLPEVSTSLTAEAKRRLNQQADEGAQHFGVNATVEVDTKRASRFVAELSEANSTDLLLLGGSSADLAHRAIMGSTASRLQRTSRCPVLTVKKPVVGAYKRALIAVDFSPDCDALVHAAQRVAPEATLVLLHTSEVPFESKLQVAGVTDEARYEFRVRMRERAMQRLRNFADELQLAAGTTTTLVTFGDPATQILEHETDYDCDLIVMGRHNPMLAERLLLGSVTKRVLSESQGDVLVVLQERREPSEHVEVRL